MKPLIVIALLACSFANADVKSEARQIIKNFAYKADDVWSENCETGDCEDLALCLVRKFGEGAKMLAVELPNGDGHMLVEFEGMYYDTFGAHGPDYKFKRVLEWTPELIAIKQRSEG